MMTFAAPRRTMRDAAPRIVRATPRAAEPRAREPRILEARIPEARAPEARRCRRSAEPRRPAAASPLQIDAPSEPKADASAPAGEMRRPRVLARAARAGAALYRREHHLRLALPGAATVAAHEVIARLSALEAELDAARRAGRPDYAPRRHVLVLSALFAETASRLAGA